MLLNKIDKKIIKLLYGEVAISYRLAIKMREQNNKIKYHLNKLVKYKILDIIPGGKKKVYCVNKDNVIFKDGKYEVNIKVVIT